MSNESIVKRMMEVCDQFAKQEINIIELGQSVSAHGSALESMGRDWEELVTVFDGECESIEMDYLPKYHYDQGMKLIKKLKESLALKFPELSEVK